MISDWRWETENNNNPSKANAAEGKLKRKMKMKKLMIVLAAVALAGATQAATMTWTALNMQAQNIEAGWLVALYDSSTTFDYAKAKDGTLTPLYTSLTYATGTGIRVGTSGNNKPDGNPFAAGDSISAYAVVFNAATIADATKYLASAAQAATVGSAGNNITLSYGNLALTTSVNKFNGATWTPAAPEPTSGILMLVGLGALALRRRKA